MKRKLKNSKKNLLSDWRVARGEGLRERMRGTVENRALLKFAISVSLCVYFVRLELNCIVCCTDFNQVFMDNNCST